MAIRLSALGCRLTVGSMLGTAADGRQDATTTRRRHDDFNSGSDWVGRAAWDSRCEIRENGFMLMLMWQLQLHWDESKSLVPLHSHCQQAI
ncbi:hypothetical protein ACLKA7_014903 [Drosophila subpalustris]